MRPLLCLVILSALTLPFVIACQSGSYSDDRAGYPYNGKNKKKMSYAEKKILRPR